MRQIIINENCYLWCIGQTNENNLKIIFNAFECVSVKLYDLKRVYYNLTHLSLYEQ